MPYYVYILFSETIQKHYIGQTNSIDNRLKKHNSGSEKFTKMGIPWTLKHFVTVDSRSDALKLERKLKNFKSNLRLNEWIEKSRDVGSE